VIADLPVGKRRMIERLTQSDESLAGKKVLVIDDDVRNIFALTSLLERHQMRTLTATSGAEAIDLIQRTPDISLALMDIMMPDMDGYETMRRIRQNRHFSLMPIIALTAKAMKGDREKCLEAGASDYIAKPVNSDQLLALLRTWLHR
jgi:CheY-like chemotaxis protein